MGIVTDRAVEAAARVHADWEGLPEWRGSVEEQARAMLEAAAPFMFANCEKPASVISDPWELSALRDACDGGGFNDAQETEEVSRWALTEIERLQEELCIARFDADVPIRELREENERLRAECERRITAKDHKIFELEGALREAT